MSYSRIIPIASRQHGIFDTITEVARCAGMRYYEIMSMLGFESNADMLAQMNQNPYPYFSKTKFVADRLNQVCRDLHLPIRIVRPYRSVQLERSEHGQR